METGDPIKSDIWEKFIFIAAYGLVTTTHEATLGDVLSDASLKAKVIEVMSEAASLARGLGVNLDKHIVETSFEKGSHEAVAIGRAPLPRGRERGENEGKLVVCSDTLAEVRQRIPTKMQLVSHHPESHPGSFDYEFKDCVVKKLIYNQSIPYD